MGRHRVLVVVVAVAVVAGVVFVLARPDGPRDLTAEQCEQFARHRYDLVAYTQNDWEAFGDRATAISVQGGVARIVGDLAEDADELRTPETDAAVDRVVRAARGYARLAGDYTRTPAVAGDAADQAEQQRVRRTLDLALSTCAPPLDRVSG